MASVLGHFADHPFGKVILFNNLKEVRKIYDELKGELREIADYRFNKEGKRGAGGRGRKSLPLGEGLVKILNEVIVSQPGRQLVIVGTGNKDETVTLDAVSLNVKITDSSGKKRTVALSTVKKLG